MVKSIFEKINKIFDIVSVLFLCIMIFFVLLQIVMRYIFNAPLVWSEEAARYSMFAMVFVGSMIAMREGEHLKVDVLINALPKRVKAVVDVIGNLISAVFLIILIWFGFKFASINLHIQSSVIRIINMGYVYLIIPLTAIGMLIYLLIPHKKEG